MLRLRVASAWGGARVNTEQKITQTETSLSSDDEAPHTGGRHPGTEAPFYPRYLWTHMSLNIAGDSGRRRITRKIARDSSFNFNVSMKLFIHKKQIVQIFSHPYLINFVEKHKHLFR